MSTSLVIMCPSCGWGKFDIKQQEQNEETSTVYLEAECERCYLPIRGKLSPGEIKFNYEKRVID